MNTLQYLQSLPVDPVTHRQHGCCISIPKAVQHIKYKTFDWVEFGTGAGASACELIKYLPAVKLHLFDSFEGLPESWHGHRVCKKGEYALDYIPKYEDERIVMHVGMFAQTIPQIVKQHINPFAFIHIDCDIYSSTKTIFDNINKLIIPGTIILFDEYYNYNGDGWLQHEYKAFMEFVAQNDRDFKYLGRTNLYQVWVEITR